MPSNFFRIRNRKLLNLILVLVVVGIILAFINLIFSEFLGNYWRKIFIALISILIAVVELGGIFGEDINKRKALYFLFITLFIGTIWDTTKESIGATKAEKTKDSLNTIENLRNAKINKDLQSSLKSIGETKDEIILLDSILKDVGKSLDNQVSNLNMAVKNSETLVKNNYIITSEILNTQTGGNSILKFGLRQDKITDKIIIDMQLFGKYSMKNIKISFADFSNKTGEIPPVNVSEKLEKYVVERKKAQVFLKIDFLRPTSKRTFPPEFVILDADIYNGDLLFIFDVESENGSTRQTIRYKDYKSGNSSNLTSKIEDAQNRIIDSGTLYNRIYDNK